MHGTSLPRQLRLARNVELRAGDVSPAILLLHYTGMDSAERACEWLCRTESKVSCHYLVDEAGVITQMVDEGLRAWHAGVGSWQGQIDINSHSIGIEIQNPGHTGGYPDFPAVQMSAVARLSRDIVDRHSIPPRNVLAHSDIAPERKIDPGEKFDWKFLHAHGVGMWIEPAPLDLPGPVLRKGDAGDNVRQMQDRLRRYGYGIETTGIFDQKTQRVVEAFQRHFRQARVDGIADPSTCATLDRLLAAVS